VWNPGICPVKNPERKGGRGRETSGTKVTKAIRKGPVEKS